jgi:glycosyltransferase involved in cell wall biosynthesis
MKKILILIPTLQQGGAERQAVTIACQLKDRGYAVEVCCYTEGRFYEHILKENGIKVQWLLSNYIKRMIKVRHYIRKGHFDAVISFMQTPNFLNDFSAIGGHDWKVIAGIRAATMSYFDGRKMKMFNKLQKYSDYIVSNSFCANSLVKENLPMFKNKARVIYNSVILPEVNSEYIPKLNGKTHFIIAAAYAPRKNPMILIEALKLMTEEERNKISIDWYGQKYSINTDSTLYDSMMKAVKDNQFENVLHLHEQSNDIINLMNQHDVVALVSSIEGLPNTILEGMMLGKPVLMTNISDYDHLISSSNGFVCEDNNAESVKNAFLAVTSLSVEKLEEMGRASKEKALKMFSSGNTIEQWINLIEE